MGSLHDFGRRENGEERETNDKIYAQTTLILGVMYNLLIYWAT
jgi:hypothetical protein